MRAVGPVVDALYPRGADLLLRRLEDCLDGAAECLVARPFAGSSRIAGIAVQTPKGMKTIKLSTLWVDPRVRHAGIGGGLVDRCLVRWLDAGVEEASLTVRVSKSEEIRRVLEPRGFRAVAVEMDRYGPGADELVFAWLARTASAPGACRPLAA